MPSALYTPFPKQIFAEHSLCHQRHWLSFLAEVKAGDSTEMMLPLYQLFIARSGSS
jgi:hypothetical protein